MFTIFIVQEGHQSEQDNKTSELSVHFAVSGIENKQREIIYCGGNGLEGLLWQQLKCMIRTIWGR
jgi:hypothetical protein